MNKKYAIIAAVLVVVVGSALAYVGSNPDKTENSQMSGMDTTAASPTVSPAPGSTTVPSADSMAVTIEDYAFSPKEISVKVGTTVTWTNSDAVKHTVTREKGDGPDSPLFGRGETYSYTFTKAGTYAYYCKPHTYMKGMVTVTP